jgi:hypothetical protein
MQTLDADLDIFELAFRSGPTETTTVPSPTIGLCTAISDSPAADQDKSSSSGRKPTCD